MCLSTTRTTSHPEQQQSSNCFYFQRTNFALLSSKITTAERNETRNPVRKRNFSLLQNVQNGCGPHPITCSIGNVGSSLEVKRQGFGSSLTPSSSEVKNGWSHNSTSPIRLPCIVFITISTCFTLYCCSSLML